MGLLSKIFGTSKTEIKKKNGKENKLIVYDGKIDVSRYPDPNSMKSIVFKIHSDFESSYGHLFTPGNKPKILLSAEGGFNLVYMLAATLEEAIEAKDALSKLCTPYDIS